MVYNSWKLSILKMKAIRAMLVMAFIFCIPLFGLSQNVGIGGDVMYNFQTQSAGGGLRVNIYPNRRLSFVPEFSYYPSFNLVNEYYLGLALEYKFYRISNFNFYAIGHGGYDAWLSYERSPMKGAQLNNWDLEGGIGVTTNKCLRPFMEYRYNVKFLETHLRIGLLYVIGCNGGGGSSGRRSI